MPRPHLRTTPDRETRLEALQPGVSLEEVEARIGRFVPRCEPLDSVAPASPGELRVPREALSPLDHAS